MNISLPMIAIMNTIKLTIRGIPVEVVTPADAFELIRLSQDADQSATPPINTNGHGKKPDPAPPAASATQRVHSAEPQTLRLTVDFLRAIQGGGPLGINTERIMPALKVTHGKAVGSRLGHLNRIIENTGFTIRDVYSNKKTAAGRIWKPRKSIDVVIAAIEAQISAAQ